VVVKKGGLLIDEKSEPEVDPLSDCNFLINTHRIRLSFNLR